MNNNDSPTAIQLLTKEATIEWGLRVGSKSSQREQEAVLCSLISKAYEECRKEFEDLESQLKIAKDALEAIAEARVILKEPELDKMKADLFEYGALQPIKDVAQDALSKLTI